MATFSSHAVPSRKVMAILSRTGSRTEHGQESQFEIEALLTQNPLSDEVWSPASGPPEVGPFLGSLGLVCSVSLMGVRSFI